MELVPKDVPPDKSVGARPSVQEKTTGIGNVGKSPCGGTNDEHQSLKEQGNLREHSGVANQEDTPTGERSGIDLLPRPVLSLRALRLACSFPAGVALDLKERNSRSLIHERLCNQMSLETIYYECALKLSQFSPETEEDRTVHMEIHRKSVAIAVTYALELSESFLVNLEGLNEAAPSYRGKLTRLMMGQIDTFHTSILNNQNIKSVLWKSEKYEQLVDKGEVRTA